MIDTASYYMVINKWTKNNESSPGYKSGFKLAQFLSQDESDLDTLLQEEDISREYFDREIYQNWIDATMSIANLGLVSAFATVSLEDNSMSYSISLYETKESEEEMHVNNPELIENLELAKKSFVNFMHLDLEVKKGLVNLTDDEFFNLVVREITFDEVESIFNKL